MARRAVYPGTFDPVTSGHVDVVRRGAAVFDEIVVAVSLQSGKKALFTADERVSFLRRSLSDLSNIRIEKFDGLVVEHLRKTGVTTILRGIRNVADFEYEYQMALTNRTLAPEIETVFVTASHQYSFISSSLIKEAALLGGDISAFVPAELAEEFRTIIRERLGGS